MPNIICVGTSNLFVHIFTRSFWHNNVTKREEKKRNRERKKKKKERKSTSNLFVHIFTRSFWHTVTSPSANIIIHFDPLFSWCFGISMCKILFGFIIFGFLLFCSLSVLNFSILQFVQFSNFR